MAYGAGRSKLLRERGMEQAAEKARYERELAEAERARSEESGWKSALSTGLKTVGAAMFGPVGAVGGDILGRTIGDVAFKSEDVKISTDVGKFGVSQKYELEDINRQLEASDKGEFWKDVAGVGTTALTAFTLGGGDLTDTSSWKDFSMTKFGGKKAAEAGGYGTGLFGKGAGGQSMWSQWLGGGKAQTAATQYGIRQSGVSGGQAFPVTRDPSL